jgi:hypothetical protein
MKYFLDFDLTLFDTTRFRAAVKKRPTVRELFHQLHEVLPSVFVRNNKEPRFRRFLTTLGTFITHGRLLFTPQELREFLYADAPAFLKTHDCTIVTYGVRAFITAKVTTALTDLPVTTIVYTSRKKGSTLHKLSKDLEEKCVFVDDKVFQLESVSRWCPKLDVIEIRRDDGAGDGRWRTIHGLNELYPELPL